MVKETYVNMCYFQ